MRSRIRSRFVFLLLLIIGGGVLLGYWMGGSAPWRTAQVPSSPVGTIGVIDSEKARERGAELGQEAAAAAAKVKETMTEAALTTKIKAKMALDESVSARAIDVSTTGSTVTLSGVVRSAAEHDRAVALARETNGIARVIDHLALAR
jgi:hyperosmotically inducible protein